MIVRPLLFALVFATLLVSGCSQQGTTIVVGTNSSAEAQRQDTIASTIPTVRAVEEEPAATVVSPVADPAPSAPPPATVTQRDEEPSRLDQPLASVLVTLDDLPALGLVDGWEERHTDFIQLDGEGETDAICGVPTPNQTSYFATSFENRDIGTELILNVMPADRPPAATDFIDALERLATCPNLEDDYAAVSMQVLPLAVAGASRSIVIAGIDATSPIEPIGLTLAAAEVDSHLFIAFVAQSDGQPNEADAGLALRVIELVLARL